MEIISASAGMDGGKIFQLTQGSADRRVKDSEGMRFTIADYVLYTDEDKATGEVRKKLIIVTADGDSIATNSATAINTFTAMLACFPLPIPDVEVVRDTNPRTGRTFFNFKLA